MGPQAHEPTFRSVKTGIGVSNLKRYSGVFALAVTCVTPRTCATVYSYGRATKARASAGRSFNLGENRKSSRLNRAISAVRTEAAKECYREVASPLAFRPGID